MKNRYLDLIQQTFEWPALDFDLHNSSLTFHGIPLMNVVEKFGTPLRLTYKPQIGEQVDKCVNLFENAIKKTGYEGKYTYCYCTKSSHFSFVLEEVLSHGAHLETSSAYDMDLLLYLFEAGMISKDTYIICNGYKRPLYLDKIVRFIELGFRNIIPILDNLNELDELTERTGKRFKIGIRIAAEEEPNFEFYTSRLGVRYEDILPFYRSQVEHNPQVDLCMLHFFINTGIRDNAYYWNELSKCTNIYCNLKKECDTLTAFDIGGGFPVANSLNFDYDYVQMTESLLLYIKNTCDENGVPEPDIFTEFGSYTVAESGAMLFGVIGQKQQNDAETWYIVDNSFITTLPDIWGIGQRFILLAVNHWDKGYVRVNLGGLTCDSMDYYNSEVHVNQVFLPQTSREDPLVLGFFNTGAYQESLSGYGGIKHCLVPAPKHVVVDRDEKGRFTFELFAPEQSSESMMEMLGYDPSVKHREK